MKVLHVIPTLDPESGGPSRSIPELCRALAESGVEVTLYSTRSRAGELTINPETEPYEIALFSSRAGRYGAARKMSAEIKSRANRFDLIHIHSIWNPVVTLAASAARLSKTPYILAPRGMLDAFCLRRRRTLKRVYAALFDRLTVEKANRLQFMNEYEAASSQNDWFRLPQYFISPNGIDLKIAETERGAFRRNHPDLRDKQIMLFLGRLHAIKGLDLQLQALSRLVEKHPDLMWVLIGPDAGEWRRLKSKAESAGLDSHVRWIGPISGPERFSALADANVVLQTSFYEGHSMTVNEALAVGAPLVITDTVHRDEVERSGAGLVVRRDAGELAAAVDNILRAPDKGESNRISGRSFANEHLDWRRIVAGLTEVYGNVISGCQQANIILCVELPAS